MAIKNGDLTRNDPKVANLKRELEETRAALRSLWIGTVSGAGKAAAFEFHRRTMVKAGIDDVGD